jgi:hypothetical protein
MGTMSFMVHVTRSPQGEPLDADTLATLRALIVERGARRLVVSLGVSHSTIERAASGGIILRGSRALILSGLQRLYTNGESAGEGADQRKVRP